MYHYIECGLPNVYLKNGFTVDLIDDEEKSIGLVLLAYLYLSKGIQKEEQMPEIDLCEMFRIRKDRVILLKSFDDFFKWRCAIMGPDKTPYEGVLFFSKLQYPKIIHSNHQKLFLKQKYTILVSQMMVKYV